jgi:hypothetical protein
VREGRGEGRVARWGGGGAGTHTAHSGVGDTRGLVDARGGGGYWSLQCHVIADAQALRESGTLVVHVSVPPSAPLTVPGLCKPLCMI